MIYSDELYVFNTETLRICWISSQALRSLGYSRQQFLNRYIYDVYPQLNREHLAEVIQPLSAGKQNVVRYQTWQQGMDGPPNPVYLHLELFDDEGKCFVHARVEPIDSLDTLDKHQLLLTQYVMDNVSIEVYWLDGCGRIHYANRKACRALGYSKEELLKLKVDAIDLLFPTDSWEYYWELLKRDGSLYVETLQRGKSGKVCPVKVLTNHLRFGDIEYAVMFVRDISKSKQLEAQFSSLISVIDAVVWSTGVDWVIDYVSPQIKEILGLSAEVFIGRNLEVLFASAQIFADDRQRLLDAVRVLKNGDVAAKNIQFRIGNAQGLWQWMELSMSAIFDIDGYLQQVVGSFQDISLQKQEESRLLDLNAELDQRVRSAIAKNRQNDQLLQQQTRLAAMGEMIANIAHQWRQPLNTLAIILLNLEDEVACEQTDSDGMRQALRRSQEILTDMSRTIDDFRGYFKNNKLLAEEDLTKSIRTNLRILDPVMAYHGIELALISEQSVRAKIHSGELSQIMLCLVNNAKEQIITRRISGGKITVSIEEQDSHAVIRVSDNAGGVDGEHLPKIFDPYFTTKSEGMGLGLYMSNITVQQNLGGHIEVENGKDGAIFSVFIPKSSKEESVI